MKIVNKVLLGIGLVITVPFLIIGAVSGVIYKTAKYGFDSFEFNLEDLRNKEE